MAPSSRGPMWAVARAKPPAPARKPNSGIPVNNDAKRKNATPKMMPGRKTAMMAFESVTAFRPPTNPAMSGPKMGIQNKRIDKMNIQAMAAAMLPLFAGTRPVSHATGTVFTRGRGPEAAKIEK
jgi:hypothetical protein